MQNTIQNGENKGLTQFAYLSKPIHDSNFTTSTTLHDFEEPQNLIEELNSIINRVRQLFVRQEQG